MLTEISSGWAVVQARHFPPHGARFLPHVAPQTFKWGFPFSSPGSAGKTDVQKYLARAARAHEHSQTTLAFVLRVNRAIFPSSTQPTKS
jgi:hypothetical protein